MQDGLSYVQHLLHTSCCLGFSVGVGVDLSTPIRLSPHAARQGDRQGGSLLGYKTHVILDGAPVCLPCLPTRSLSYVDLTTKLAALLSSLTTTSQCRAQSLF